MVFDWFYTVHWNFNRINRRLDSNMSKYVVFDVDGTLMNINERRRFVEQRPKDWDSFNDPEKVSMDKPVKEVFTLAALLEYAGYKIVVSSGRKKKLRDKTLQQLKDSGLVPYRSYFRSDTDFRPDVELKRDHLQDMILHFDGDFPEMAFDDRDSVVDMWRENAIKTFQPERGNF